MAPASQDLPVPPFFDASTVGQVWRVPYQARAAYAQEWAATHNIPPAAQDGARIGLLLVDVQNTFCLPDFELFAAGRSGQGAIEDNVRLCEFIYRNLPQISHIIPTMDTHTAVQIFHPVFWMDNRGQHPAPHTVLQPADLASGTWQVNPAVSDCFPDWDRSELQQYARHYLEQLNRDNKHPLTVWPYHALVGSISHALVSAVEEAVYFHSLARGTQAQYELKGQNPLTEHYSVLRPEVLQDHHGNPIAQENRTLIEQLLAWDAVIIAGQAKSHCVAWTVEDLLREIQRRDPNLARKFYLLEDCTSPVVVPDAVDFSDYADAEFERFARAGMHVVSASDPLQAWPEFPLAPAG
ncbi:MAG: isochorismatase [Cyanobacteria bacterium QS_8_64_29]|nr:MAG: isochorismatase [Cyanobacteria bacterium QS_8_64_29]